MNLFLASHDVVPPGLSRKSSHFIWWDSIEQARAKHNYFLFCRSEFYLCECCHFCEKYRFL